MLRVSIPWIIEVVGAIEVLETFKPEEQIFDGFLPAYKAKQELENLFSLSIYAVYLKTSRERGNVLYAKLTELLELMEKGEERMRFRATAISSAARDFKLVFLSEVSTLPVFIVQQKSLYDSMSLIDNGAGLFPVAMLAKCPEAASDAGEVGKALAFSLMTACGFHTFRVLEAVLKRYWDAVSNNTPRPSPETIGKFAGDLENRKLGDVKIAESLKQIAKLHRNPCIHPDVVLSEEDAITVLGIARSAISAMLAYLPDAPIPTTISAASSAQSAT